MLGTQLGKIEIARGPDKQIDLIEGRRECLARHGGESRFPDRRIRDRIVHQDGSGLA
jgi:hypothetical protein